MVAPTSLLGSSCLRSARLMPRWKFHILILPFSDAVNKRLPNNTAQTYEKNGQQK
jgi:hypothetical protein